MAEWSIAAVLKTVEPRGSGGSNPSFSAINPDNQVVTRIVHDFVHEKHPKRVLFLFIPPQRETRLGKSRASTLYLDKSRLRNNVRQRYTKFRKSAARWKELFLSNSELEHVSSTTTQSKQQSEYKRCIANGMGQARVQLHYSCFSHY